VPLEIEFQSGGFAVTINFMNRSRRRIPRLLIAAFVVSLIAIWQVIQVSAGSGLFGKSAEEGKSVAVAANERGDMRRGKIRPSSDPVAAYLARAKRGMTEQEIRRIIRDFEAIETTKTSWSEGDLRDFREKQNEWYLAALSEALSLTSAQKRAARASLKESLDQALNSLAEKEDGSTVPSAVTWSRIIFVSTMWLKADEFAPWNLCELTDAQSALTLEAEWRNQVKAAQNIQGNYLQDPTWFARLSVSMKEPFFGSVFAYEPGSTMMTMPGTIPGGMIDIPTTFRLTPDQKLADHPNDMLAQVKILHPAQLRLGLLLNPSFAGSISNELDKPAPGE
jgi:hypothetical protein